MVGSFIESVNGCLSKRERMRREVSERGVVVESLWRFERRAPYAFTGIFIIHLFIYIFIHH